MSVEFYKDTAGEHRWHITEVDDRGADLERSIIHACHEGFSSKHNALQNLLINHALMGIFINKVARITKLSQDTGNHLEDGSIFFEEGSDEKVRWKIKSSNGELVGMGHKGFEDMLEAMNDLIITYTMLTVFVAEFAQAKSSEID